MKAAFFHVTVWLDDAYSWLLLQQRALWGLSAARILVGIASLGILLTNFSVRHVLWGPGSFWAEPFREDSEFGVLLDVFGGESTAWFTLRYLILIAVAVAVILGWHARLMTLLLALGMSGLVERADILGDQGDNIARIGLTLMVLMNTSAHWSLDARRRRRRAESGPSLLRRAFSGPARVPEWGPPLLHNAALVALALQVFILYTASAMFKVQGSLWQDGTAVYYPLHLPEYSVFPWLNTLLTDNPVLLNIQTYISIFAQLFFMVALLHPLSRRLALIGVIGMHAGIALLMGLPWFSLAMIAFDSLFISSRMYRGLDRMVRLRSEPARRAVRHRLSGWRPQDAGTGRRAPATMTKLWSR